LPEARRFRELDDTQYELEHYFLIVLKSGKIISTFQVKTTLKRVKR
jgi:hypothetical protein